LLFALGLAVLQAGGGPASKPQRVSAQRNLGHKPPAGPLASAAGATRVSEAVKARIVAAYGQLPLSFEANRGQADPPVRFLSHGHGYSLLLTPTDAVLHLRTSGLGARDEHSPPSGIPQSAIRNPQSAVLRMRLMGANPAPDVAGLEKLPGKVNYFTGNDPTKWRTNIPTYARVQYRAVYPGVDLVYYGNQQQLEYDFVVAPGASPKSIRLAIQGADKLDLDERGDLVLHARGGEVRLRKPVVYQETAGVRNEIAGGYTLQGEHQVGLEVGAYDGSRPLVIDPTLAYSTFLGGSGDDQAKAIAVDSSGNAYVTGSTASTNFPRASAVQSTFGGNGDAFVAKLNAAGSALVYSTYLGGNNNDIGLGIAVDSAGNAYVAGLTESANFPRANALQAAFGGGSTDAFVVKLNTSGSALVYSTYLGGSGSDEGHGIAVDSSGNAYVTGSTSSGNFPRANALQSTFGGNGNAFVAKLNAAGSALVYSTYLGGSGGDIGQGIAVDSSGNAYVTGVTASTNFPVQSPLQRALGGVGGVDGDAFVAKLNAAGSALVYSTYLGGSALDYGYGIAVDSSGNAYVTGFTSSGNFPTASPRQTTWGGAQDAFVAKLNAAGSALVYSTYLGGNNNDVAYGIAVDSSGNAYVTGYTISGNFPGTSLLRGTLCSDHEAFVTKFNTAGSLVYSTCLGGYAGESGNGIAVDSSGNAYVTGWTQSSDFPTANPFQATFGGPVNTFDAFIAKIVEPPNPVPAITLLAPATATAGATAGGGTFILTVYGSGFISSSVVIWNGAERSTQFVSSSKLTATIPATDLATAGTAQVTVFNPAPGGGMSNVAGFTISPVSGGNPAPTLSSLSPATTAAGAAAFTLTANGTGFVSASVVRWNGSNRTTAFVNANQLQASIFASDVAVAGIAQVTVFSPPPGGGLSNAVNFTITAATTNPVPAVTLLIPSVAYAGGSAFTLTVTGRTFVSGAVVRWNGANRTTTFVSDTQLTASIPASDIAAAGTAQVTVFNPAPGGGTSAALAFSITTPPTTNPVSTVASFSPAGFTAGGSAFTLFVAGTGFVPGAVVRWNGSDRPTSFVSSTLLLVAITAADVATAGSVQVTVFNPPPGGGLSVVATFTISPPPSINVGGVISGSTFNPNQLPSAAGIGSLFGINLAPTVVVADRVPLPTELGGVTIRINGIAAPLFFVSPQQINFQFPWELVGLTQLSITATVNGVTSPAQTVTLAPFAPGIFTVNQQGTGQAAILISGTGEVPARSGSIPGRAARPVKRGEYIEIYCSGLGPVANPPANGDVARSDPLSLTITNPTASIGNVSANVVFSGLAPGFVGLYQVNVQVPDAAPAGDAVQLVLSIGGANSNTVTIAVQ
jgi:uncharacterized protein (TIGR03437 family)